MKDTTPATHSPLPWQVRSESLRDNKGLHIATLHNGYTTSADEDEANAAYIVKTANAHPLLVEALKEVHGRMERPYIEEELRMGAKRPMERCEPLYQKITALLASLPS